MGVLQAKSPRWLVSPWLPPESREMTCLALCLEQFPSIHFFLTTFPTYRWLVHCGYTLCAWLLPGKMSAILMGIFRLALALPAVIPHIPLSLRVSMPRQKWKGQSCWGDILSEERSMPVSPSHERTSRSSWPGSPSAPKAHYSICCPLWGRKGGSGKSFIEIVSSTGPHVSAQWRLWEVPALKSSG